MAGMGLLQQRDASVEPAIGRELACGRSRRLRCIVAHPLLAFRRDRCLDPAAQFPSSRQLRLLRERAVDRRERTLQGTRSQLCARLPKQAKEVLTPARKGRELIDPRRQIQKVGARLHALLERLENRQRARRLPAVRRCLGIRQLCGRRVPLALRLARRRGTRLGTRQERWHVPLIPTRLRQAIEAGERILEPTRVDLRGRRGGLLGDPLRFVPPLDLPRRGARDRRRGGTG